MKLAEALILRADAQKRIQQLRERLNRSAKVQEGESPPEEPQALLEELQRTLTEFVDLMKRINRTNVTTAFDANTTLTDALADRDGLSLERSILVDLINAAAGAQFRYGRSEIKYVSTIDVAGVQKRADDLAKRHRELDTRIQQLNWSTELVE
ncbi:MAG: DIP1984 family protein [Burkholderiales bacterium]|nr:DIP1984 family protein [Anaerolineae bacterium]